MFLGRFFFFCVWKLGLRLVAGRDFMVSKQVALNFSLKLYSGDVGVVVYYDPVLLTGKLL